MRCVLLARSVEAQHHFNIHALEIVVDAGGDNDNASRDTFPLQIQLQIVAVDNSHRTSNQHQTVQLLLTTDVCCSFQLLRRANHVIAATKHLKSTTIDKRRQQLRIYCDQISRHESNGPIFSTKQNGFLVARADVVVQPRNHIVGTGCLASAEHDCNL